MEISNILQIWKFLKSCKLWYIRYPNLSMAKYDEFAVGAFAGPVVAHIERLARRDLQSRLESALSLGPVGDLDDEVEYFKKKESK